MSTQPLTNYHKDDLDLVDGLSREQLSYAGDLMDKYSTARDLDKFNQHDIYFIITLLKHFAVAYKTQGDLSKAYSYIKELENVCKTANINDTYFVANNHFIKASLCLTLNDTETDIEYYFDEVDRICKLLIHDREARSLRVQNLLKRGEFHKKRNEEDKALEIFSEVLKNTHHVLDKILSILLISTYEQIGSLYKERAEIKNSIDTWTKGLEIAILHYGENNSRVFFFCCDLAEAFYKSNKSQEGLSYMKKALQVALNFYPSDHCKIAWCNHLLGKILLENGQHTKALNAFKKAIKLYEKQTPIDFSALSEICFQSGVVNHHLDNDYEAFLFFSKSAQILAKSNEPDMLETYLYRARELKQYKRLNDCEIYLKEALIAWKKLAPHDKQKFQEINFFLEKLASQTQKENFHIFTRGIKNYSLIHENFF